MSLLFLAYCCLSLKDENTMTLKQAMDKKLITCEIKNNAKSTHFQTPISISINNLTDKDLNIKIDKGLYFHPQDSSLQNIIIVKDFEIPVLANAKGIEKNLNGYCCESHDGAPGSKPMKYKIGKLSSGKMKSLVDYIFSHKLYNNLEAQRAVWTISDNHDLADISGYDTSSSKKLQVFLSKLTGKKLPPPPAPDDYQRNYYPTSYVSKISISGNYNINYSDTCDIRMAMFDTANVCVRELFVDRTLKPGPHNIKYEFDASQFPHRYYFIRMVINNEIMTNSMYDLKTGKIKKVMQLHNR